MPSGLLRASDAARAFGCSIQVIVMWRNRGWVDTDRQRHHLEVADRDRCGRPLYRWTDLLHAERSTRQTRERGIRGGTIRHVRIEGQAV
jgi:hypothetical protein